MGATGSQRYSDHWKTFLQGEYRTWEGFSNLNEVLFRLAVQYDLNPKTMLSAGYVRVDTWPYENEPYRKFFENRMYEEYLFKVGSNQLRMDNRFRLEQRWITSMEEGKNYSNRFRYMMSFNYNFTNSTGQSSPWYLQVFNEVFLDFDQFDYWFDREAGKSGLNQNRLYAGIGHKFSAMNKVQAGFLWQHRPGTDFYRIVVGYNHNLDFRN